jgi:hypothetical protein
MVPVLLVMVGAGTVASVIVVFLTVVAGIHGESAKMGPQAPGATASVARWLLGVRVVRSGYPGARQPKP